MGVCSKADELPARSPKQKKLRGLSTRIKTSWPKEGLVPKKRGRVGIYDLAPDVWVIWDLLCFLLQGFLATWAMALSTG